MRTMTMRHRASLARRSRPRFRRLRTTSPEEASGEVELRGDDVGGIAVHTGARVAALASAGEVLVSSTVKDLVAGSGIKFVERGTDTLKGVPGEWPLYAVAST